MCKLDCQFTDYNQICLQWDWCHMAITPSLHLFIFLFICFVFISYFILVFRPCPGEGLEEQVFEMDVQEDEVDYSNQV